MGDDDHDMFADEPEEATANGTVDTSDNVPVDLRFSYRKLLDRISRNRDEIEESAGEMRDDMDHIVDETMDTVEKLFANVETPQEAVLDAKLLKQLSLICRYRAEGLSTNVQAFKMTEYADKLLGAMNASDSIDDEDSQSSRSAGVSVDKWAFLGSKIKGIFARPPALHYLYGSLDKGLTEHAEKKRKSGRVKGNQAGLVPTSTQQIAATEESSETNNSTEALVASTFRQLVAAYKRNDKRPLDYFSFVIDPNSFCATVENIFHVSFLVKERKVQISVDNDASGLPVITPLRTVEEDADGGTNRNQVVIALSMREWTHLKNALGIKEATIQHGTNSEPPGNKRNK